MKVLMVCLGNICRSPLAEGIMRDKIRKMNLPWEVDSCGTSAWHLGEHPHRGSLEIAQSQGVDMTGLYARQFEVNDFDRFDLILVMDEQNEKDVLSLARSNADRSKVRLILKYNPDSQRLNVPDPYFEGGFDGVYDMLDRAIDGVIEQGVQGLKSK